MRAVSVKLPDGRTLTLMPFASVAVKRGQAVAEGEHLGTLGASGDVSSQATHVHVGLKKGGTYYDPMALFGGARADGADDEANTQEAPAASGEVVRSQQAPEPAAEVYEGQTAMAGSVAGSLSEPATELLADPDTRERAGSGVGGAQEGEAADWQPGMVTSGEVMWSPAGAGEREGLFSSVQAALAPLAKACRAQAEALVDGLGALSRGVGLPAGMVALGMVALLLVGVIMVIYGAFRWGAPFVSSLWRSANTALSGRGFGATMHRLFPAPGSAFIARGR